MAERPVFIPCPEAPGFVKEINLTIPWASGFAVVQKKKNIASLHGAADAIGLHPLLEISTKSEEIAGRHLSAFHLKVSTDSGLVPLECAFQGSKFFEMGGPYNDLFVRDPKEAKRDARLTNSGKLLGFKFKESLFPLEPKTVFYDWLYISAIYPHRIWLKERLSERREYAGFTDIEFNPAKSINCQARSCALFVTLMQLGFLDDAIQSPEGFIQFMTDRHVSDDKHGLMRPCFDSVDAL